MKKITFILFLFSYNLTFAQPTQIVHDGQGLGIPLSIGTTDLQAFTIKTNNIDRLQISQDGILLDNTSPFIVGLNGNQLTRVDTLPVSLLSGIFNVLPVDNIQDTILLSARTNDVIWVRSHGVHFRYINNFWNQYGNMNGNLADNPATVLALGSRMSSDSATAYWVSWGGDLDFSDPLVNFSEGTTVSILLESTLNGSDINFIGCTKCKDLEGAALSEIIDTDVGQYVRLEFLIDDNQDLILINANVDGSTNTGITNLSYTSSATQGTVVSDTGTDAVIPAGSTINASLMLPADKTKLDFITVTQAVDLDALESAVGAAIDGSGTTNVMPKFSDTNTLTNSFLSENGSSVILNVTANNSDAFIVENTSGTATTTVQRLRTSFGGNDVRLILQNTSDATTATLELDNTGLVLLENASSAGLHFDNDRLAIRSTSLKVEESTPAELVALTAENGDIGINGSTNTGQFKLDDVFNFYEAGKWVDRLEYHIGTEVSTATETALWKQILPVNTNSNAVTVSIPSGAEEGDWFIIADSRGSAGTNNITVDFVSASYNFHGSSQNRVMNANNDVVKFVYIDATVGFIQL